MSSVAAPADRRFRRGHVKPVRKRGRWRNVTRPAAKYAGLTLVGAWAAYAGGGFISNSRMLEIDQIVIRGNERLSSGEVVAVLGGLHGENIVRTDLEAWRGKLLAWPWVQNASMRRLLPSTIEVEVSERHPIGIARLGGDLFLVDDHGVVIDKYGTRHADFDLPIVDGLLASADSGVAADSARAQLAARVILALRAKPDLTRRLSQIDVTDEHNVGVILSGDPAVLYIGEDRFLARVESYIELAAALRERVPDIDYVDLRFEGRIYVHPASARKSERESAAPAAGQGLAVGERG